MSKDVQKNRLELIKHLYSLQDSGSRLDNNPFKNCQPCAKKVITFIFTGHESVIPYGEEWPKITKAIAMNPRQIDEMEARYEGWRYPPHTYFEVADWLQTLPGWPQIKPLTLVLESVSIVEIDQGVLTTH